MVGLTEILADTDAILTDWGQTSTLARLSSAGAMLDSFGQVSMTWSKVTTGLVSYSSPGQFQKTSRGAFAEVTIGGVTIEVRKVGMTHPTNFPARPNDRVYLGGSVTTTAEHWFVALVNELHGHNQLVLTDKGPRMP